MGQRGFVVEQNPLNIVTFRQFPKDLTARIFAQLLLVTIKSLRGTLLIILFYNRMVAAPLVPEAFKVGSKVRDYSIGV